MQIVMVMVAIAVVTITIYKNYFKKPTAPAAPPLLEVRVYQPDSSGWGYQIYHQGKLFIQQAYIPAVAGEHRFSSKTDAEKTAELVKKKLLHHESPTVTKVELDQLGVRILNQD